MNNFAKNQNFLDGMRVKPKLTFKFLGELDATRTSIWEVQKLREPQKRVFSKNIRNLGKGHLQYTLVPQREKVIVEMFRN